MRRSPDPLTDPQREDGAFSLTACTRHNLPV